jgi:hypothetical protein
MEYRTIEPRERKFYFDFISKRIEGNQVELEVAGLDIGDQIETEWTLVEGISYDPKLDTLHIHTQPNEYMVVKPQEVIAVEEGILVRSVCVRDRDGHLRIIHFREPLKLPWSERS